MGTRTHRRDGSHTADIDLTQVARPPNENSVDGVSVGIDAAGKIFSGIMD